MDMRICKFMNGGFGRSFVGREGKSIFRINVHSSGKYITVLSVSNSPMFATRWLADAPRESYCLGSLVLVSAMVDWSFSGDCGQITTHRVSGSQYS